MLAGCSADVSRFDAPSFGLTEDPQPSVASDTAGNGFGGTTTRPRVNGFTEVGTAAPTYTPAATPSSPSTPTIRTAALPDIDRNTGAPRGRAYTPPAAENRSPTAFGTPQSGSRGTGQTSAEQFRRGRTGQTNAALLGGSTITVVRGDTLYGLSRRHSVSVNALMAANSLTTTLLKPGQTLVVPNGAQPAARPATTPTATARRLDTVPTDTRTPGDWAGRYTVRPGDSLYVIAKRNRVRVTELQQYNGIADPRRLRPGQVLKVPSQLAASSSLDRQLAPRNVARSRIAAAPPVSSATREQVPAVGSANRQRTATLGPGLGAGADRGASKTPSVRTLNIQPNVSLEARKLTWPVRGRVISGFGPRTDGTHNDGVNVAVPLGTDVVAADKGVVAYAGSELKGYGNLILVRHDNGWVTAYAHNERLLVKRGDKVGRGQAIAKAGSTGEVTAPQVHFELRQGAKPVDPVPFLERS